MHNIILAGAGKIGSLIACLLLDSGDYNVFLVDEDFSGNDCARIPESPALTKVQMDISYEEGLVKLIAEHNIEAIVSCMPYYCNEQIAVLAKSQSIHYFDLTEDTDVTASIKDMAQDAESAFVPQCGVAPGFIGIVAHDLMGHFDEIDGVRLRVGALPVNVNNALQYSLTWSTDGVINEYANPCYGIERGEEVCLQPLEGLETIEIDGKKYEAFNTSGGLGSLADLYQHKVQTMNYKTIRYPGHCGKMRFLMKDLKLKYHRNILKQILESAIPKTYQDVVIIYVSVTGTKQGDLVEKHYLNKIYPQKIAGYTWSAIQVATSAGICSVIDTVFNDESLQKGFIFQENIPLQTILDNRFGKYFLQN